MAAEAGGDIRAGIGSRLRAAREKKSLTILQAAEKMHVDARILESLEAEDFAALGAPVYARGHLRHYAELVGESPTELRQLYTDSTQATPAQPDLTRIARGKPAGDSGKLVGPAVIGVVAVGLVGVLWWLLTLSGGNARPTAVHGKLADNAGSSQPAPVAADADADIETPVPLPAPPPESTPRGAKTGVGTGAKVGADATAVPPGGKSTAATRSVPPPAAASSAAAPVAVANVAAPPPATRSKDGELTLKFSSDSWAEVYDATGQRLFYDVGAAASAHTMKGPAPLRVILGNASGVAVEFNGRPAHIRAGVQPDGSTRFIINAHGHTVPASPASHGD